MAILYFGGLPGAGKSYEAVSTQIAEMLKKGREVVAYIEGLESEECQAKLAEACELDLAEIKRLLFPLTRDDMKPRTVMERGKEKKIDGLWIDKTRDNAFHVFDEAQNWWPQKMAATHQLTEFVSEHRHRGIDVLLMGQSWKDVHVLWRRRIDQRMDFLKLTALGTDKRYRMTIYKGKGNDEYDKVGDKIGKYDARWFGTYKSHVAGDINTATYTDKRANFVRQWVVGSLPICIGLAVWGGYTAWKFFHPPEPAKQVAAAGPVKAAPPTVAMAPASVQTEAPKGEVAKDSRSAQEVYFSDLTTKYRPRLAGLIEAKGRVDGVVEWVDGGARVFERLTLDQLRDLGTAVQLTRGTVRLTLGGWSQLVTMWPTQAEGVVSQARLNEMRPTEPGGMGSSPGLVVLDGQARTTARTEPAAPLEQTPQRTVPPRRS